MSLATGFLAATFAYSYLFNKKDIVEGEKWLSWLRFCSCPLLLLRTKNWFIHFLHFVPWSFAFWAHPLIYLNINSFKKEAEEKQKQKKLGKQKCPKRVLKVLPSRRMLSLPEPPFESVILGEWSWITGLVMQDSDRGNKWREQYSPKAIVMCWKRVNDS